MSNVELDDTIREIAAKHGVAIGRDDPVLILQTINARLISENTAAQQELLARFRDEMVAIQGRWEGDARRVAEQVLNAALAGGRETLQEAIRLESEAAAQVLRREVAKEVDRLADCYRSLRLLTLTNTFIAMLSAATMLGAILFLR